MKVKIKKTVENDGFEKYSPAFDVTREDLAGVRYPCYIILWGSYSNRFDWSVYDGWEVVEDEDDLPYCQRYGGSFTEAILVSSEEEALDLLNSCENSNYDDGSHEWETVDIKIEVKGWNKTFYLTEFFVGSNNISYYSLFCGKTNTYFTAKEEINLYKKLKNNKELINIFDEFDLSWREICKEQIDYIEKFM